MTRPLRIALIGGFGGGNFGNDASLKTALGRIASKLPEAQVAVIGVNAKAVTERFGVPAFRITRRPLGAMRLLDLLLLRLPSSVVNWALAFWFIRSFDVLLFPGTGIFDDYRTGPMGFPAQVFRWSVAAKLSGVSVIFQSVGAGPIINSLSRFFLKTAARCAVARSYRDADSKAFMQSIGVDERNSPVAPDIVFALPTPARRERAEGDPLTIGVGVMAYRGWRIDERLGDDYLEKLARFIRYVEGRGCRVRLIVGERSDKRAVARVNALLADEVDRGGAQNNFTDVMAEAAGSDVLLGSRFHVLIAGLKLGRPCISLNYGPKHAQLMAEAGIGEFAQDADRFDYDLLVRHFETIAADLPRYENIVRERVGLMRERLLVAEGELFAQIATAKRRA